MFFRHYGRLATNGALALMACAAVACNLPRDADGTLDRVRGGTIRVGFVVDTPWVTDSAGVAGGIEPDLVAALAGELGARIDWVHGEESALLQSLSARELDLVIGGLTADSPWKQQVAMTMPYYADTILVAGAAGSAVPSTVKHLLVAVKSGDPTAALIRKKKGTPVLVGDLATASGPIAAPIWRLSHIGRAGNPNLQLAVNQHVLAASPGENAWLVRIERMLIARRDRIPVLLRSSRP